MENWFNIIDVNDADFVNGADIVDELPIIPRHIYQRRNYFESYNDTQFFQRFRLTKPTVLYLLEHIEHRLEYLHNRNNSISPINQLLLCLRVYATGGHLISVGDFIGADKSTVSRVVSRVSHTIAMLARAYIKMPNDNNAIAQNQNDFFDVRGFPKVVGAIDGTHVRILSTGGADAEVFRNRKGCFSINVQAVTTADLVFQDIVANWPGSTHDATIFNSSRIKHRFERGDFGNSILLGDSGYMCKSYLLTPLLNTNTPAEENYNTAHIATRVKIEHIFGVWKRRFPILAYGCRLKLQTTLNLIVATAVLHNIARSRYEPEPPLDPMQHQLQQLILNGDIPNNFEGAVDQLDGFVHRRNLIQTYFE